MVNIKKMIHYDEGYKLVAYRCSANHTTVGYGHNIDADPALNILHRDIKVGDNITPLEADALYEVDMNRVITSISTHLTGFTTLPDNYKAVLINMAYNLGTGGVLQFKNMIKSMQQGDTSGITASIKSSKYAKQLPGRSGRMIQIIEGNIPDVYV